MSDNKLMQAYSHLLEAAKQKIKPLEEKSWEGLQKAIDEIEVKAAALGELTEEELQQVREDLKADVKEVAEYLEEVGEGVEEFIEMDLPVLEKYLADKALSLADPTELAILRLRMMAALEDAKKHKHEKK
jgi:transcription termination factor NusB